MRAAQSKRKNNKAHLKRFNCSGILGANVAYVDIAVLCTYKLTKLVKCSGRSKDEPCLNEQSTGALL